MQPHDNLAIVAGAPRELEVQGRRYRVAKLTPRMTGRLQALVEFRVPDPRAAVRRLMEGLPEAVQIHMWERACDEARSWPPGLGSPAGLQVMMSPDGIALLVELVIAPGVPGMSRDQCEALADAMSMDDVGALMELASPGDPHAPKATAAGTTPPGDR